MYRDSSGSVVIKDLGAYPVLRSLIQTLVKFFNIFHVSFLPGGITAS